MMPQHNARRPSVWLVRFLVLLSAGAPGCTSSFFVSPNADKSLEIEAFEEELGDTVRLVKDLTTPWGTDFAKVEGVALVTGLPRTGSDPPPSSQRVSLIGEMQTHEVKNPNFILASLDTSLVLVRAYLPPGVKKGDRIDVEVRVPSQSETKSLRNGWLMQTRMREVAILDSTLHTGRVETVAEGPVVVEATFEGDQDDVSLLRGRVLGGGVSTMTRPLGLVVRGENLSIKTSTLVGAAINGRFHTYDHGVKKGVATPKRDSFIEMELHPRYAHNLARYIRVIRNIAVGESAIDRVARMELLERKLLEPATASMAALQLEAIGKESIRILQQGLKSEDPEVRFYAAEALAYLDDPSSAEALGAAARNEPGFRWHAIAALSAMDHVSAHDELSRLLHVPSAETRYAAFMALRSRNPLDSLVKGEMLGGRFNYHEVDTTGPTMIHLSSSRRAEIVVFGKGMSLRSPSFLYAGEKIMLKGDGPDRIKVMRFEAREEKRELTCSPRLDDVVRTIVEIGGGYADVVQFLQEAKEKSYLDARIVVNALPFRGRVYRRDASDEDTDQSSGPRAASPLPDLFNDRPASADGQQDSEEDMLFDINLSDEESSTGWWNRLGGWFTGD